MRRLILDPPITPEIFQANLAYLTEYAPKGTLATMLIAAAFGEKSVMDVPFRDFHDPRRDRSRRAFLGKKIP